MIFSLLFLSSSIPEQLNIDRNKCGANIGGKTFDLSGFSSAVGLGTKDIDTNFTLYYRICGGLFESDIPTGLSYKFDMAGIIANKSNTDSYEILGVHGTQDYSLIDPSNASAGVVIYYRYDNPTPAAFPHEWTIAHSIQCDPSSTSTAPTNVEINSFRFAKLVTLTYRHSAGCPVATATPAPSTPPQAQCLYKSENYYQNLDIDFDIRDENFGGQGHPFYIDSTHLAFIQPCGVTHCPPNMTCDVTQSALWICTSDNICNSYASLSSDPTYSINGEVYPTLTASISGPSSRSASIKFKCNSEVFPKDPVFEAVTYNGTLAEVTVSVYDLCPFTDISFDHSTAKGSIDNYEASLNLSETTVVNGSSFNIPVPSFDSGHTYIVFNPKSAVFCPAATCDSGRRSNLWLCTDSFCQSFGIESIVPSLKFLKAPTKDEFASLTYKGESDYTANINLHCLSSLPAHSLSFTSESSFSERTLTLSAYSSDICSIKFTVPSPQSTATPTAAIRQGTTISVGNSTHSSTFDATFLSVMEADLHLRSPLGVEIPFEFYMSPFINLSCPYSSSCIGSNTANAFGCWRSNNTRECYPLAFHEYPVTKYALPNGAGFESYGPGNYKLKVNVVCSASDSTDSKVEFSEPSTFTATLYSTISCLQNMVLPTVPPTPQPTPSAPTVSWKPNITIDGKTVMLSEVKKVFSSVMLKMASTNQGSIALISPGELIGCPSQANCNGMGNATAWKCWESLEDSLRCYPIADYRYGFKANGLTISYEGGYSGTSMQVKLVCNRDLTTSSVLSGTGEENGGKSVFTLSTSAICSKETVSSNKNVIIIAASSGVIVAIAAYLGIGSLIVRSKTGQCGLPNAGFWMGFIRCITCRMKKEAATDQYYQL